jgi:hypothetical protein
VFSHKFCVAGCDGRMAGHVGECDGVGRCAQ